MRCHSVLIFKKNEMPFFCVETRQCDISLYLLLTKTMFLVLVKNLMWRLILFVQ